MQKQYHLLTQMKWNKMNSVEEKLLKWLFNITRTMFVNHSSAIFDKNDAGSCLEGFSPWTSVSLSRLCGPLKGFEFVFLQWVISRKKLWCFSYKVQQSYWFMTSSFLLNVDYILKFFKQPVIFKCVQLIYVELHYEQATLFPQKQVSRQY
jgi:hypothetical protein